MQKNKSIICLFVTCVLAILYFSSPFALNDNKLIAITSVILVFIMQVIMILMNRGDIKSPLVWYLSAIIFYHYSGVLFYVTDFYVYDRLKPSLVVYGIIYFGSAIVLSLANIFYSDRITIDWKKYSFSGEMFYPVFVVLFLLSIISNMYFYLQGYGTKAESILSGATKFNFLYNWLCVFAICLMFGEKRKIKKYNIFVSCLLLSLLTALNTGERNVVLSFVLLSAYFFYYRANVSKAKIYSLLLLVVLSIPVLQGLKNVFSNSAGTDIVNTAPIYIEIFQGEFLSASRNIDWYLNLSGNTSYTYGVNIIKDLIVGFSPINLGIENSQTWFNNEFFPHIVESGRGYGFSLYMSGYHAFGFLGLLLYVVGISGGLSYFYKKANENANIFVIYLLHIPFFIYSLRGDLSVLLSFSIKQTLLPLGALLLARYILRKV